MKTFDYETAWKQEAKPQFEALPDNVRSIYWRVVAECGNLGQLKNLDMPWPKHGEVDVEYLPNIPLQVLFDKLPAELLSVAARVIYSYGHWFPGNNPDKVGGHWKFANYADQSLANRINETLSPHWPDSKVAFSVRIHEGLFRARYSTRDSWTWEEICTATAENWAVMRSKVWRVAAGEPDNDPARFKQYCEDLIAATRHGEPVYSLVDIADRFMVDETEIAARKAKERAADPAHLSRLITALTDDHKAKLDKLEIEYRGKLWLLEHGIDTDNAIYYSHTGRWCFGWHKPLTAALKSELLDVLTEFPYDYDLKEAATTR